MREPDRGISSSLSLSLLRRNPFERFTISVLLDILIRRTTDLSQVSSSPSDDDGGHLPRYNFHKAEYYLAGIL